MPSLPVDHIYKLLCLLSDRYQILSEDPKVKYIFQFENRGEEVGVTMPHPHGQIYAYPLPQKFKWNLIAVDSSTIRSRGVVWICDMNQEETQAQQRVIAEKSKF